MTVTFQGMEETKQGKQIPWFDVQLTPNFGYVGTQEAAKALREFFELQKALRFTALRTSANFGKTDTLKQKKKLKWADIESVAGTAIPFDGVPFLILDKNTYECEYGKDHKLKQRAQRKSSHNNDQDDAVSSSRRKTSESDKHKKRNCPAKIRMKEVMKFPDFKLDFDSRYQRNKVTENLNIAMEKGQVVGERRIYISFPRDDEHKGHDLRSQVCVTGQHVDERIINLIDQLIAERAERTVEEVSQEVSSFVEDVLSKDGLASDSPSFRLSPGDGDISYHMEAAIIIHTYSKLSPEELPELVTRLRMKSGDQIYFRRQSIRERLLLVHQTAEQQQIVRNSSNATCFLDSTCTTTLQSLPLLLLSVRTEGGRHHRRIVASAILQEASREAMREALRVVWSWNPSWSPSAFATEFENKDMGAAESVFSGVPIHLCDYHRSSEWRRWLRDPTHVVEGSADCLLALLEGVANARSKEEYCRLLQMLRDSDFWQGNPKLRAWFGGRWLPHYTKWAQAFLSRTPSKPAPLPGGEDAEGSLESDSGSLGGDTSHALVHCLRTQCLDSLRRLTDLAQRLDDQDDLGRLYQCLHQAEQQYDATQRPRVADDAADNDVDRVEEEEVEEGEEESEELQIKRQRLEEAGQILVNRDAVVLDTASGDTIEILCSDVTSEHVKAL
ncbi:uncharacterized protein [Diadema setosum]|uniref:uncharacterized protein n=1 Tax=Diadema setosum TaxID=31175 RepID=UPI003B3B12A6